MKELWNAAGPWLRGMSAFFVTAFLVPLLLPLPEEIIPRRIVLVGMIMAAAFIGWAVADIEFEVPEASPEAQDPAPPSEPKDKEIDFLTRGFLSYCDFFFRVGAWLGDFLFRLGPIEFALLWAFLSALVSILAAGLIRYVLETLAGQPEPYILFVLSFAAVVAIWLGAGLSFYLSLHPEDTAAEGPPPPSFRERLSARLRSIIIEGEGKYPLPTDEVFDAVLAVGEEIYNEPRRAPPLLAQQRPFLEGDEQRAWDAAYAQWERDYALLYEAVVQSLSAYLSHLPRFVSAPFSVPLKETRIDGAMLNDITRPFTFNDELKARGLAQGLRDAYYANVSDYTYGGKVKKPTDPVYPQHYQGKPGEIADTYLKGTPFHMLFDVLVPYSPFTEKNRIAHHWCIGRNQQGKTTFLRHMLRHDLEEAAQGKCSLVVIDSKTLIGHMRTLKQFAPGGPLDGRLILIDSDHPFPLNPFKIADKAEAKTLLMYMLGNFMEMAGRQPGALAQYLNGVLNSRDKSLHTLLKYVRMDDHTLPNEIKNFPDKTQEWFKTTRKGLHVATESGIEQRLDEFLDSFENSPAMKHLSADSWGLDLYDELHGGGKVLLVDTDRQKNGKAGVSMLGRLIIALVGKLASDRMKNPGPPVWVYVDEAADYLRKDETFIDIYTTAAEAKVGMTVAYQYLGQIQNPVVEKALENASIHSECLRPGTVSLEINRVPSTLEVQRFEFKEADQMEPEEIEALDAQLAKRYPYAPSKPAPPAKSTGFDPTNIAE